MRLTNIISVNLDYNQEVFLGPSYMKNIIKRFLEYLDRNIANQYMMILHRLLSPISDTNFRSIAISMRAVNKLQKMRVEPHFKVIFATTCM